MRADLRELVNEVQTIDPEVGVPLGTAQWMGLQEAATKIRMPMDTPSGRVWVGEAFDREGTPLGYGDDRHVCLVSGTRGGKGAGVIVPNLCTWPGSCIVIDPKGENANVTARRRGDGSDYCHGIGQDVRILDPFGEVQLASSLRARFNPLDVITPDSDLAVDDAGRIAAAIVVPGNQSDPFWEDASRNLLKGLVLHVLSYPTFEGRRNLITVRRLLTQGDKEGVEMARQQGAEKLPTPFAMLWETMRRSTAFDGVVAGIGEQMAYMAEKTRSGVLEVARTNTAFIDGAPMQRLLEASDFDLADLKTAAKGLTLYLTLPQRYMDTHFRWLRLMVSLAVGEMERIKGKPRTGYPTLFLLDEFAGLKRMEVIENAVAQAAGFGVKFFFVIQNIPQLRKEYEDAWENFISNSGLKIFFQIDDHFTREYLSRLLGEREVRRSTRSGSESESKGTSRTKGWSSTVTEGESSSYSSGSSFGSSGQGFQSGNNRSSSSGYNRSEATGRSFSHADTHSASATAGWSEGVHKRALLTPDEIGRFLARIDDRDHPVYPGMVMALMPGQQPLAAHRINYFEASWFEGLFDPHPNHAPPLTLADLARRNAARKAAQALPPPSKPVMAPPVKRRAWYLQPKIVAGVGGLCLLALIAMREASGPGANASAGSYAVVDHTLELNVRDGPGANFKVLAKLNKGDPVRIDQSADNGWRAITVQYDNGTSLHGFVNGDFLTAQ